MVHRVGVEHADELELVGVDGEVLIDNKLVGRLEDQLFHFEARHRVHRVLFVHLVDQVRHLHLRVTVPF